MAAAADAKTSTATPAVPPLVGMTTATIVAPPGFAPKSARGSTKEDLPPTTTPEQDIAFLKSVTEACTVATVTRACQSLKWHVDNPELVMHALKALAGLASDNPKKQTLIQQKGGIPSLINAMKKYPSDLKLQEEACLTMIAITDQHDSNTNLISKLAIPLLMETMKANDKNVEYTAVSIHAMDIVCAAASGRKEGALKGVAQLVMEVMKKHTLVARIQERGSGVLRHLASDSAGKKIILDNGGVAFLQGLQKLFPNSSVLDENCTEALKRIQAPAAAPTPSSAAGAPHGGHSFSPAAVAASAASAPAAVPAAAPSSGGK